MTTRLRKLRDRKGFTQIRVQMLTGIDQSDYSKLEAGIRYPTIEQAKRLSKIFDTSIDYIVGVTDDWRPYPKIDEAKDKEEN